ncbi:hypothetical protein RhiTH_009605 [Rhizoctonia solani]
MDAATTRGEAGGVLELCQSPTATWSCSTTCTHQVPTNNCLSSSPPPPKSIFPKQSCEATPLPPYNPQKTAQKGKGQATGEQIMEETFSPKPATKDDNNQQLLTELVQSTSVLAKRSQETKQGGAGLSGLSQVTATAEKLLLHAWKLDQRVSACTAFDNGEDGCPNHGKVNTEGNMDNHAGNIGNNGANKDQDNNREEDKEKEEEDNKEDNKDVVHHCKEVMTKDEDEEWAEKTQTNKQRFQEPILDDFEPEISKLLCIALKHLCAESLGTRILEWIESNTGPKTQSHDKMYWGAWKRACKDLGQRQMYWDVYGTWFSQRLSTYQNCAMKLVKAAVDNSLGFTPCHLEHNAKLAKIMVLREFHIDIQSRYTFHSLTLHQGIQALAFEKGHLYAIQHPKYFNPLHLQLIAYVCAMINHIISLYWNGLFQSPCLSATLLGELFREYLDLYEREEAWNCGYGKKYCGRIHDICHLCYKEENPGPAQPKLPPETTWGPDMEEEE